MTDNSESISAMIADWWRLYHHVLNDGKWDYRIDTRRFGRAIETIERQKNINDTLLKEHQRLIAENSRLRDVYEAVTAAIESELEQNHDLHDLTPLWRDVDQALAAVSTGHDEKCMFCDTRIPVPEPNTYAVICAPCRQKAYDTADKMSASTKQPEDAKRLLYMPWCVKCGAMEKDQCDCA